MSKKRICLLAVGLTLLLAAGFFLALPRTLFDEPFSATVWSRDGRLLSAKVAPDGQWRFFPTDSVPGKFRTAITTYEDKRFDRHFGVDPLALARAVGLTLLGLLGTAVVWALCALIYIFTAQLGFFVKDLWQEIASRIYGL